MGLSRYWDTQTVTSNLFRAIVWLFLRVIPSPRLVTALPVLYAIYLGSWITGVFMGGVSEEKIEVKVETTEVTITSNHVIEDEIKVTQVAPSKPAPHGTLSTLFLSLPTQSFTLRTVTLLVNSLLLASIYDFIIQPARNPANSLIFTRIGAVDPDGAKIVVRWPDIEGDTIRVLWRQTSPGTFPLDAAWKAGPLISLSNASDWVGVGRIGGLWPSTSYEYRLAYANSTKLPYPESPIPFRTFPDPRLETGNHFKFIVSSCMQPNFPYLPFQGDRIRGLDLLSNYIWPAVPSATATPATIYAHAPVEERTSTTPPPLVASEAVASEASNVLDELVSIEAAKADILSSSTATLKTTPQAPVVPTEFMLFLGDFIYAEVPHYGGDDVDAYRRLYRRTYASPSFRKVYERLPIITVFDDHEIYNNFVGKSNTSTPPYPNAFSAYQSYNGQANYDPKVIHENYYEFRYGDVAYFLLDTRLHRSGVNVEEGKKVTMLGEKQLSALHEWLEKVNTTTTFKFIVSSVPFTSLWTHDAHDTWAGYLEERDTLLSVMATVPNIFVLSGDRHEFAAIEFLGGKVVEFSTSPLSMFYIPIVRTLKRESKRLAPKYVQKEDIDENGNQVVRNELDWVPEERVMKYLPLGNYKWSAIEIDTTDRQKPTLKIDVVINGRTEWRHAIVGQPVILKSSSAIGTQITRGLKGALGRIGLSPAKWF